MAERIQSTTDTVDSPRVGSSGSGELFHQPLTSATELFKKSKSNSTHGLAQKKDPNLCDCDED